jgi:tRNA (pseudouridine54-N1)-methyltransferase
VYLVLQGGTRAPRTLRFDGPSARFLRPDERSLALLVHKSLAAPTSAQEFMELRSGIAVLDGGLDVLLPRLPPGAPFLLEEQAEDIRTVQDFGSDPLFFVGDHLGLDARQRASLADWGATPVSVGPLSVHAEDAITLACNELDRRQGGPRSA